MLLIVMVGQTGWIKSVDNYNLKKYTIERQLKKSSGRGAIPHRW